MSESVQIVKTTNLRPNPWNRKYPDDWRKHPELKELAASIKGQGMIQPIIARPVHHDLVEIVAGEGRWRAAQIAELDAVPVIVRDISDKEAVAATFSENKDRYDPTPMESAHAVDEMMKVGWTYEEIADKLGKNSKWVSRRVKILSLSGAWKKFLEKNPGYLGAVVLEKIARLPEFLQDKILSIIKQRYHGNGTIPTPPNITWMIANNSTLIAAAPWKMDDAALVPAAGPCSTCKKRTDCQPELFDRDEFEERKRPKGHSDARCLDASCWEKKKTAWTRQRVADLKAKNPDAVVFTTEYNHPDKSLVYRYGAGYTTCKKSDKGAVKAVYADGNNAGQIEYVKKLSSRSGATSPKPVTPAVALKQKRQVLHITRYHLVVRKFLEYINNLIEAPKFQADDAGMLAFVAAHGTARDYIIDLLTNYDVDQNDTTSMRLVKDFEKKPQSELLTMLFRSSLEVLALNLSGILNRPPSHLPKIDEDGLRMMCDFFHVSYQAWWDEACTEKKEPKSWAKLEAEAKGNGKAKSETKAKVNGAKAKTKAGVKAKAKSTRKKKAKDGFFDDGEEEGETETDPAGTCRVCGCTENHACMIEDEMGDPYPCSWTDETKTLCTKCKVEGKTDPPKYAQGKKSEKKRGRKAVAS
ncbi:MAG: hypothetical protein AMXMBFR84_26330 [Candidatus Hydrogenedentota bacterium]